MDLQQQLQATLGAAYRIERELGGGGMSRVFVASDTALGRRVVVKVLSQDLALSVSTERFRHEIQLAASLQHPHIVPLLAAGEADGMLYFTMPFIDGESLRALLTRSGELGIADTVSILLDVTRALVYAHRQGIAHRDIKPENVMISDGGALVLDFGVAKALSVSTQGEHSDILTGAGVALGTPAYMSPEQASADPTSDHRSDIYSLGVVAYELLAGFTPFAGRPLNAVFAAHATEVPDRVAQRRASVPTRLSNLIAHCLAKRPADRPSNAESVLHELEAISAGLSGAEERESEAKRARGRRRTGLIATGVVLAAVVTLVVQLSGRDTAAAAGAMRTTAVLPFVNMSASREDESFSDGMTEELIGALGQIGGLRVKSAFALKGTTADLRDVGRQLEVQTVVAGSVRRAGGTMRISARLVNAADGFQMWSNTFERELRDPSDVFRVQDEITSAIVDALKLKLGTTTSDRASRRTANLEAYRAYLDGRFFMAKRTTDGLRKAIESFTAAVAADPQYALAWAGLADAEALSSTYGFLHPAAAHARARRSVDEALRLDSTMAEAHANVAYLGLNFSWDWAFIEREFERAIVLDPNYATAHHWYSLYLNAMGRHEEALREIRRALELDPLSLIVIRELGRAHYYSGALDSALVHFRRTLQLDPNFTSAHVWIARVMIARGEFADAVRELQDRLDFQGGHSSALLAVAYARTGQREKAEAILAELHARSRREHVWPMYLAVVHLGLGDRKSALDALEQGYTQRSPQMAYVRVDPIYAELRRDARFERIVAQMRFAP